MLTCNKNHGDCYLRNGIGQAANTEMYGAVSKEYHARNIQQHCYYAKGSIGMMIASAPPKGKETAEAQVLDACRKRMSGYSIFPSFGGGFQC